MDLDTLKRIDLRQYAASLGYQIDRRKTTRNNAVMELGTDKIVIKVSADGHYVYFSVRDDRDHGTILDFIRYRTGKPIPEIARDLAGWKGFDLPAPPMQPVQKDLNAIRHTLSKLSPRPNTYLTSRGIPARAILSRRFNGCVLTETKFGNAIFPHVDDQGVCGYEIKNYGYTSFSTGGEKGLWRSNRSPGDLCVVFAESAIDALSYAIMYPSSQAVYVSIGGRPSLKQQDLIRSEIERLPGGGLVMPAMDSDIHGRELASIVKEHFRAVGRRDLSLQVEEPESHKDWNEQLMARLGRSTTPPNARGTTGTSLSL